MPRHRSHTTEILRSDVNIPDKNAIAILNEGDHFDERQRVEHTCPNQIVIVAHLQLRPQLQECLSDERMEFTPNYLVGCFIGWQRIRLVDYGVGHAVGTLLVIFQLV
jgi:hypothetical protein